MGPVTKVYGASCVWTGLHDLSWRLTEPCEVPKQRNSGAEELRKDKKRSGWVPGPACRAIDSGQDRVKAVVLA